MTMLKFTRVVQILRLNSLTFQLPNYPFIARKSYPSG